MYVIVGFRVDVENNVFYRKVKTERELKKAVVEAFNKGAQYLSVRKIQVNNNQTKLS